MLSYNLFKTRIKAIEDKIYNKESETDILSAWDNFKKIGEQDLYEAMRLIHSMLIHGVEKDNIEGLNYPILPHGPIGPIKRNNNPAIRAV